MGYKKLMLPILDLIESQPVKRRLHSQAFKE
jgi:hypothetical protein